MTTIAPPESGEVGVADLAAGENKEYPQIVPF